MDYAKFFTPGAPVSARSLLVGREQELTDLRNATTRPGLHPIVIGNRGVGKTSLVRHAFPPGNPNHVRIGCTPSMTFSQLSRILLTETGLTDDATTVTTEDAAGSSASAGILGIGASGEVSRRTSREFSGPAAHLGDAWHLFMRVRALKPRRIIVLDEYDAVSDKKFHTSLAYFIKHLADQGQDPDPCRIIVVGVAQSAADLLGRHESIERSAREIYLRPLRREDILDFLCEAERECGFTFDGWVKKTIAANSMGYPYYVHLLGLECLDAMTSRKSPDNCVTRADYNAALYRAVQTAFRSELRKFRDALRDATQHEMAIVRAVATAETDWNRIALEARLTSAGTMTPQEYAHAWVRLQQEKRVIYVSRNQDTIRFADPLMGPFLRSWFTRPASRHRASTQLSLFGPDI